MFGSVADDRRSLLLVAGLALVAAYLAGGGAVAAGLEDAIDTVAGEHAHGPRLAHLGSDPFAGAPIDGDGALLRLAHVTDTDGVVHTVAAVDRGTAALPTGTAGLGVGVHGASVTFPGNVTATGRVQSDLAPRGWVFLAPDDLDHLQPPTMGHALLLAPDDPAPDGATVTALTGAPGFLAEGGRGVVAGFAALVLATGVVAISITASLTAGVVESHRADVHLYRSMGATRGDVTRRIAAWLARVLVTGIPLGAALGIIAAYATFSLGNRLGFDAPVTPGPDTLRLVASLAIVATAALAAGLIAGHRVVRRLEGERLEAVP